MTTIVTGAASGLGAAVTARLRERGERVVTVDLRDADVTADLGTVDGRVEAVAGALALVDGPLAALVPCAGLGPQVPDHALIASVNYFGAIAFLDDCLDALAAGAPAAVVAISSNSTTIDPTVRADLVAACTSGDEPGARALASELAGNTVYASSKVAIARAVRARVADWGARGVRINAVAPGPFMSPLLQQGLDDPTFGPLIEALPVPTGAIGTPAEVAAVIDFLLGPEASYVHGSIVFVDGGIDALLRPDAIYVSFYGPEQAAIHDERFGDLARDAAALVVARVHDAGMTSGLVTDLGCGSGILAAGVIDAGFDATGVDLSPAMVELARIAVPLATFTVGSVHDVTIAPSVAVTATGEVLQYATDPQAGFDALRVLAGRVYDALVPGGVFVFDVSTPGRNLGLDVRQVFHDHDTWMLGMHATEPGHSLVRRIVILVREADGRYRRVDETHELHLYEPVDVTAMLEAVGFAVAQRSSYTATTPSTPAAGWAVFVATKPRP